MTVFIFDVGKVLMNFDLQNLQDQIAASSELCLEEVQKIWQEPDLIDVESGKINSKNYFNHIASVAGLEWNYRNWVQVWADIFTINNPGWELFLKLKKQGYPLYMLSNLAEYNKEAIELKYPDFFNKSIRNYFSFEMGYHKPDPRIYKIAALGIGVEPQQCVFLDDIAENVKGAISVGMNGIIYSNNEIFNIQNRIEKIITQKNDKNLVF